MKLFLAQGWLLLSKMCFRNKVKIHINQGWLLLFPLLNLLCDCLFQNLLVRPSNPLCKVHFDALSHQIKVFLWWQKVELSIKSTQCLAMVLAFWWWIDRLQVNFLTTYSRQCNIKGSSFSVRYSALIIINQRVVKNDTFHCIMFVSFVMKFQHFRIS